MADERSVDYVPVSTHRADWEVDHAHILACRGAFDPAHATEHAFDSTGHHYLASIGHATAGYLCIDHDGHLAVALTAPDHADDIAEALLRQAVLDTPRRGLTQLAAPANHPWHTLLQRLGFSSEHSHDRHTVSLFLPPDRTSNATGSPLVRLETIDEFRRFAIDLVQQARRSLILFSEDLEPWLYDNDDFTLAVMQLAQKSRNSQVRLLIRDTRPLLEHGHRLLRASHRAPDKIHLRKLPSIQSEKHPCFLIADDNGLLYRQDPQVIKGIGYTDYRARTKPLLEQFEQLWSRSGTDPDLRQHTV